MTQFNFSHVQTVLKITLCAVQTRFSRLDQSQSWNFMKVALTKITAYRGWTPPPRNLIEWVSIIIFGLHPQEKCLKLGEVVQLYQQWFWPSAGFQLFRPSMQWNFKKKFSSACSLEHTWTMIVKQFFSPMHTVGSRVTESKKHSNHIKSGQKLHCAGTAVWWSQKKFLYHQGRQDR